MKSSTTSATGKSVSGFTLLEMMVVLAIAGILAAIALPSFKSLSQSQRVKSASYELYTGLSLARSEAIKRNAKATLAVATNAKGEPKWAITTTATGTSTPVNVRSQDYISGVAMTITPSSPAQVVYTGNGRTTAATTFQIDASGVTTPTQYVRCVTIELSGMPRIRQGTCP